MERAKIERSGSARETPSGDRVVVRSHGLLATENVTGEPASVLTPANESDDGLLTATDVACLKLSADLVILSACDTAAPCGRYGADGLSGLARAFFYAGARTVLVSHWPVDVDATETLPGLLASPKDQDLPCSMRRRALRGTPGFATIGANAVTAYPIERSDVATSRPTQCASSEAEV